MAEALSVREKIVMGEYEVEAPYPTAPTKPAVLSRTADRLSDAEFATLPTVRIAWVEAQARHRLACADWQKQQSARTAAFHTDLLAEHGIPAGDPFGAEMYAQAWDRGHSAGFDEIVSAFESLLPLWELYRDKPPTKK